MVSDVSAIGIRSLYLLVDQVGPIWVTDTGCSEGTANDSDVRWEVERKEHSVKLRKRASERVTDLYILSYRFLTNR